MVKFTFCDLVNVQQRIGSLFSLRAIPLPRTVLSHFNIGPCIMFARSATAVETAREMMEHGKPEFDKPRTFRADEVKKCQFASGSMYLLPPYNPIPVEWEIVLSHVKISPYLV